MSVTVPPGRDAADGPVGQSLRIGFAALQVAMLVLGVYWATSNIRTVPPDSQAVVTRFGRVVRVAQAGLVTAWPRPFEDVVLLPGPQRQLSQAIQPGTQPGGMRVDAASRVAGEVPPDSASIALTGDGGVILLDATLTYRITDARAYFVAAAHVAPALRRLFLASAVAVTAQRGIDDFLVVRTDGPGRAPASGQAGREALRGALVDAVNRRLVALTGAGAGLGITVTRADVTAYLPPAAKFAFDSVLEASQMAEQGLAAARTGAARADQTAQQEHDRRITEAHAAADERVGAARSHVAAITALAARGDPASRPAVIDQFYRERITAILHQAASITTVDMGSGTKLLLPGGMP